MTHGTGGSGSIRAARFLMRTGRSFPVEAHPESESHFGIGARLTQVLGKQKSRLEREFQPVANARLCLTDYERAPSRKKRRLK